MRKPSGKTRGVFGSKSIRIWVFAKIFKFSIRKSQWKIDFCPFSRNPEAAGEFFAFSIALSILFKLIRLNCNSLFIHHDLSSHDHFTICHKIYCNLTLNSTLFQFISVVYTGFRGWGGAVPAGLGGGFFFHWRNDKFRIFSNSKIFKKC